MNPNLSNELHHNNAQPDPKKIANENKIIENAITDTILVKKIENICSLIEKALKEKKLFELENEDQLNLQKKVFDDSWNTYQTQQQELAKKSIQNMWESLEKQFILLMNEIIQRIHLLKDFIIQLDHEITELTQQKPQAAENAMNEFEQFLSSHSVQNFKINGIDHDYNEHLKNMLDPIIENLRRGNISVKDFNAQVKAAIDQCTHSFVTAIQPENTSHSKTMQMIHSVQIATQGINNEIISHLAANNGLTTLNGIEEKVTERKAMKIASQAEMTGLEACISTRKKMRVGAHMPPTQRDSLCKEAIEEMRKNVAAIKSSKAAYINDKSRLSATKDTLDIDAMLTTMKKPTSKSSDKKDEPSTPQPTRRRMG